MSLLQAIIMGIVQGVAEFLPISSSGHLAIFKHILNIDMDTGLLFDVLLHLGTLVAIFIAFWKDIRELIVEGFGILGAFFSNIGIFFGNLGGKKREYRKVINSPYRRFVMLILVSTIPTGIMGILLQSVIESASETILIPGIFLIFTAVLLLIADRVQTGTKQADGATWLDAGVIGVAQGFATMPGLSRSGTTIAACLLCGFDRNFAVKYSFIMSIPAVLGAVLLEVKDFSPGDIPGSELISYLIGTVAAAVVGYICIKTMLVVVRGKKFRYFSVYCLAVGVIAVAVHFMMK
ncbi:MAG TPA: undecaprenyl-diphosphate phosphatase [Candidatus Caccomorpha excrementavium]|nr:undecaprenyl-diphosphate phosphatase [Candidatus Caccomorpha excrementavium]